MRQHCEPKFSVAVTPYPAAIAGADAKTIVAWRQVAVFGHASGARVHPVFVPAIKPALKLDFVRINEAQAGVAKFKPLPAGWNFERRLVWQGNRLGHDLFDHHGYG